MNKGALLKEIIARLARDLESYAAAARASHAEATHEQSKAESKYDTRGLEAAYLARGQSRQAAAVEEAIEEYEALAPREFGVNDPIDLGAVVELEGRGERFFYFIGPRAGGTEIEHEKREVLVITTSSPLGGQLLGKRAGDRFQLETGGARDEYHVVSVA